LAGSEEELLSLVGPEEELLSSAADDSGELDVSKLLLAALTALFTTEAVPAVQATTSTMLTIPSITRTMMTLSQVAIPKLAPQCGHFFALFAISFPQDLQVFRLSVMFLSDHFVDETPWLE